MARWSSRLSLRTKLTGGFAAVIALTLMVGGVSMVSRQRILSVFYTNLDVNSRVTELSLRSKIGMLKARRYEKDFLLKVREYGFYETRSRYATLVQAELAEIPRNMDAIRALVGDPQIGRQTREIEEAVGRYGRGFEEVVRLHGVLGRVDTGLEGRFRDKAHEIESLVRGDRNDRLMKDLLQLRRHEKDFLMRGLDRYLGDFSRGVAEFRADVAATNLPPALQARLGRLAGEYESLVREYAQTSARISAATSSYLTAVNTVEPMLETLHAHARRSDDASRTVVQELVQTSGWTIAGACLIAVLLGFMVAFLISRHITRSVRGCIHFAGRIAQGDLSSRMSPGGGNEFATLAVSLNGMADALQNGRLLQEQRSAELTQANEALRNEVAERKRFEERLEFQSNHDGLTGLPNRNLLVDRVQQAISHVCRSKGQVALLFVDLDNFKFINDSLGHSVGDRVLKLVAERLAASLRAGDTVARYGGDEFVVILVEPSRSDEVAQVAQRLRDAVSLPLRIDEHELVTSCSVGISMYPEDTEDVPTLLKYADAAMHLAKEQGRDTYHFFTGALNDRVTARMTMEKHLRRALERDEFFVCYQPQVDLHSGRITGMEALLRWQNPELGMVSPGRFIPLAEETGLIVPIGEWVLRTACTQNRAWQEAGLPPLTMATNLSARQFWHHDLIGSVSRALLDSGLEPRYLELEIIESMVMQDVEAAAAMARGLKALGVQMSMDDFGTGYSSLSYLKRFPFDKLKIDLSFVREITSDPGSAAIAKTIIAMAHNLNLHVIAEGVETEGQLNYLRAQGCDEMQGFYFSRPVPAPDLERMLRENRHLQLPAERCAAEERTLLLVDDEAQVVETLEGILRGDGYRILTATSAAEGFELLAANQVGVILADHRMPGMSGAEFLGRIKALYPDTIRIALSGFADYDTVTEAVNRGAIFKFLTKPWDVGSLRQDVREAFRYFELASGRG